MTDIEKKALALLIEVDPELADWGPDDVHGLVSFETLCRAIEQHEAFRQEVSDAVQGYFGAGYIMSNKNTCAYDRFARFIIPKHDPLVEAIREMALTDANQADADRLCEAIAKRGGKIVWDGE